MARLTHEYLGGIFAGFGLSLAIRAGFEGWHPALVIPGFALIGAGALLARSGQRQRTNVADAEVNT